MDELAQRLKNYIEAHPIDPGDSESETVLGQLYQAYAESHESDPPEIRDGFKELDDLLGYLSLENNNNHIYLLGKNYYRYILPSLLAIANWARKKHRISC